MTVMLLCLAYMGLYLAGLSDNPTVTLAEVREWAARRPTNQPPARPPAQPPTPRNGGK